MKDILDRVGELGVRASEGSHVEDEVDLGGISRHPSEEVGDVRSWLAYSRRRVDVIGGEGGGWQEGCPEGECKQWVDTLHSLFLVSV